MISYLSIYFLPLPTTTTKKILNMAKFKRILLKLSGESLMGEKKYGIDEKRLGEYAQQEISSAA